MLGRRRLLAALCVAVGVFAGLRAVTAPPPPTVPVVVARHDLPAGAVLTAADLVVAGFAAGSVPSGVVPDPAGRTLATAVRRGEPLTEPRLLGPALVEGHQGLVVTPVRLPDASAVGLLRPGDRLDLLATDPRLGRTHTVATDVLVLALPADGEDPAAGPLGGRLVVLGIPAASVEKVADAAVQDFLSFSFSA